MNLPWAAALATTFDAAFVVTVRRAAAAFLVPSELRSTDALMFLFNLPTFPSVGFSRWPASARPP